VTSGDTVVLQLSATTPPGTQLLTVRLPDPERPGFIRSLTVATPSQLTTLERRFSVTGWGSLRLARPDWVAATGDGLFVTGPVEARELRVAVIPAPSAGGGVAVPPRTSGQLGSHRARTPGEGSEVLGVREFRPGDLLRRIDWRVTNRRLASRHPAVRQAALYVRTTVAETDSEVLLLVDTRLDISPAMADWDLDLSRRAREASRPPLPVRLLRRLRSRLSRVGRREATPARPPDAPPALRPAVATAGGSLDATVAAAVSVAADHVRAGDRVTLIDLGRPRASLAAGAGRRHLDRIRFRLGQVTVDKLGVWRPGSLGPSIAPLLNRSASHAVTVVVSAFYDAEIVDLTVSLARGGRDVVALDTAPRTVVPDPRMPYSAEALALVLAERRQRLARLRNAGVSVRAWLGPDDRGRPSETTGARGPGRGHAPVRRASRR